MIIHGDRAGGPLQVEPEWVPMGSAALVRDGTVLSHGLITVSQAFLALGKATVSLSWLRHVLSLWL